MITIPELILIKPKRFVDNRGFFAETYSKINYKELGVDVDFVQDNHSLSKDKGTLRGLHFQAPPNAQGKLVRCGQGAIFDVAVDIRKNSPTYGKWQGFELTADNGYQLYVPVGFAHGFVTLAPNSEIVYKCTDYYSQKSEGSIHWSDQDIAIDWPLVNNVILSEKDQLAPKLKAISSPFEYLVNT